jgi:type II secretory pathway component PulK
MASSPRIHRRQGERGIALLLVLLLSLILVPFASEFTMQVNLEATTAVNVSDELKIENAIDGQYEVMLAQFRFDLESNETDTADDEWNSETVRSRSEGDVGVALTTWVWDEHSKFNLLQLGDEDLERRKLAKERLTRLLLEYRRDTEEELSSGDAEQWAEQISEWVNRGSLRANLPKPNVADKRRSILVLDELDLLPDVGDRRFSQLLADQKGDHGVAPGLHRFVTIYGDGKLNLNTVDEVILRAYFPRDPELAERIIERRESAPEEDEPTFSNEGEEDQLGNPYTAVEQINEVEGVDPPTLQENGVDANLDFTTRSNFFSMRIIGETQTSRRDELFVIERVPEEGEEAKLKGFRLLLRQERTDILETLE